MDTTLRQRFPYRTGIFNSPTLVRPIANHRGFATSPAKSLPYLGVNYDSSPLADHVQGHSETKNDMGGLISIIGGFPLVGVVQKLFTSFFSPPSKEGTKEELPHKEEKPQEEEKSLKNQIFETNCDNCGERESRKRTQKSGFVMEKSAKAPCCASSFNPSHFYHKSRVAEKNRLEKQRHNIQVDMHEDFGAISSDDDFDPITDDAHFASFEIAAGGISPKLTVIYKSSPDTKSSPKGFIFSMEDFPSIPEPKSPRRTSVAKSSCYRRKGSMGEHGTDEEFVVFDEEAVNTTPSSGTGTPSLKSLLINRLKCRTRQLSECSDDSCVIFFESDGDQQDCWSDTDLSEAEEADEDSSDADSDDDDDTVDMDLNQQPDSGFEEREKKVRFNLKPAVHVMRTWDYAYRQARLGPWERYGRDRERFMNRICRTEQSLAPIFDSEHRQRVFKERFAGT